MFNQIKERIALILIILILMPLFIIGFITLIFYIMIFGRNWNLRQSFRVIDNFINVTLFGGFSWETLSSHAWRERDSKIWAPIVIFIADICHKGHCQKANIREQPIVDYVKQNYLDEQTIKF